MNINNVDLFAGIEGLLRKGPLTIDDWIEQLEARKSLLVPFFDDFSLPPLSSLKCIYQEGADRYGGEIGSPISNLVSKGYSLGQQGVFNAPLEGRSSKEVNGYTEVVQKAWGLTRDGDWVSIVVKIKGAKSSNFSGRSERYHERVEALTIEKSDIKTILFATLISPAGVMNVLDAVVIKWRDSTETRLKNLRSLAYVIGVEQHVRKTMSQRSESQGS